ncbi:MAG TPA: cytochrome c maturation protein CcmE [Chloroflexota bacterium]|nr:cytochrome c maturation protein CcmE [Chloroflexota bacterium]
MAQTEVAAGNVARAVPPASGRAAVRPRPMRRPVALLATGMAVIVAALAFLAYQGLTNNLVYYITPSELLAKGSSAYGQQLRVGGQVRPGSQQWDRRTRVFTFVIQDPRAHIAVTSRGLPPALFASGIGVVVQGSFNGAVFHASQLMVKHSSNYVAPKPGHLPKPDNYVNK